MGAENSRLRAGSLRILRTLSGGRFRGGSSSSRKSGNSSSASMENLSGSRTGGRKSSSSRQTSGGKPKSESVRYKTKWPYPHVEKDFLPVYNMKPENQKDFTISHVIASGAYGSVLRGFENKTHRDVAVKVIDKARVLSEGQGAIQQCKDEVLIQSELPKSPYIVELVAFWQTRNRLYLVLEYIPNGELFDLWKTIRVFSESLARFYISQITLALDFLHRNNVVYRDLKMENILLDGQGGIKLIDFGLSKQLKEGDRTTTTCGTLQYTAPEVLRGEAYGKEVDWWSMGVLGYAILSGKFPVFGARDHVEMRHMVASHQYRMPLHLSNEAADLLTMLLQKNPDNRVHVLNELLHIRYFHNILEHAQQTKLYLRDFLMKQDMDKIPDTYALKDLFNAAYKESLVQDKLLESKLQEGKVMKKHEICDEDEEESTTTNSDYAEPIWNMTSGNVIDIPLGALVTTDSARDLPHPHESHIPLEPPVMGDRITPYSDTIDITHIQSTVDQSTHRQNKVQEIPQQSIHKISAPTVSDIINSIPKHSGVRKIDATAPEFELRKVRHDNVRATDLHKILPQPPPRRISHDGNIKPRKDSRPVSMEAKKVRNIPSTPSSLSSNYISEKPGTVPTHNHSAVMQNHFSETNNNINSEFEYQPNQIQYLAPQHPPKYINYLPPPPLNSHHTSNNTKYNLPISASQINMYPHHPPTRASNI